MKVQCWPKAPLSKFQPMPASSKFIWEDNGHA
jgi:hypothetical protein